MSWVPSHYIADVIIHVVLVALFVGVFYFTYATVIETSVIKTTTVSLTSQLMAQLDVWLSPSLNTVLEAQLKQLKPPDLTQVDAVAAASNSNIKWKAIYALGGLTLGGVVLLFFLHLATGGTIHWRELFTHNATIVFATAVAEFTFLTAFAQFYRPAALEDFKVSIFQTLKTWSEAGSIRV
jgi:hypothetical protein